MGNILLVIVGIVAGKLGGWAILASVAQIKMGVRGMKKYGSDFLIWLLVLSLLYIVVFVLFPLAILSGLAEIAFLVVATAIVVLWLDKALSIIDEDEDIKRLIGE
jgi:heme O synthase-like polyprenyltransferase